MCMLIHVKDRMVTRVRLQRVPCAGEPMIPLSWQEMQCPRTKTVEKRKVAKTA
jgi:exosome complex RNA-binding protein Csl4